jgi:hypothetical protein
MVRLYKVIVATWLLLGCDGCNRNPPPLPPRVDAGADGAVAAGDAGPRREDPCDILTPAQRSLVVARVGDQSLTLCDFTKRINSNNPYLRARFNAPEQRRALLDSWLDAELLAAEAHARGLDDEPDVRRGVTMHLARQLERVVRNEVPQPEVSDGEVRAWYEAHRSEYETEAQVRASQIAFASRAAAEQCLVDLRAHPDDDAVFRDRVRRLSVDAASRAADGDLGFFGRAGGAGVPPEVAAAAFGLTRTGEIPNGVIESARGGPNGTPGFHVVRLTAKRDAMHRTLEEESRRIRGRLLRERRDQAEEAAMQALVARLRSAATVQVDEAALARVTVTAPAGSTPPALRGALPPGMVPGVTVPH